MTQSGDSHPTAYNPAEAKTGSSVLKKTWHSSNVQPKATKNRYGFPDFKWSFSLFGLCLYTFSVITFKFPLAQPGIAIGMMGLFFSRDKLKLPAPIWLYLAFLLWGWVSLLGSPFSSNVFDEVIERFKLLVIIVLIINALRDESQLRFYLLFVLLCFILFPVRGTLLGGDVVQGRAVWTHIYNNPNDLAALCLLALGIAASILFSETTWTWVRIGSLLSAVVLLIVILLTQSRGVFIGLIVAALPSLISLMIRRFHLAVGIGVVLALIIGLAMPSKVFDRLLGIENLTSTETIAKADPEGSAAERFEIQKVGWQIFVDNPIVGIGLGAYRYANNMYAPQLGFRDTHNTYLNLAAETGLPGLILWCAMVGTALFYSARTRRYLKNKGALATQQYWIERSFIGYLVAALVGTYSQLSFPYIVLSILWCSSTIIIKSYVQPKTTFAKRT